MDFIQSANKAVDKFGTGKHGFQAGNPTTGVQPTAFTSEWCDHVQQELVNAIEGAGLTINPSDKTQLSQAIQLFIAVATVNQGGYVQGIFKNLQLSATGENANVSLSADAVAVESSSFACKTLRSVALTINSAAAGANGLDTGTLASNSWYSVWVIWNGTTTAGLLSASATAPNLPSGYTHKARVGWIRTDGTGNKHPLSFKQYGRSVQYVVSSSSNLTSTPTIISGAQGAMNTTLVAVSVSSFVPPTASRIRGLLYNGTTDAQIAPNSNANLVSGSGILTSLTATQSFKSQFDFLLESTNVYYAAASAGAAAYCTGWDDNI